MDLDALTQHRAAAGSGEADRFFRADIEDHDRVQPLQLDEVYTIAFDVGKSSTSADALGPFPLDAFAGTDSAVDIFELTVQLDSTDVEILGDRSRPLRVPRTGPSRGKARFEIKALHTGRCLVTASIHLQGNFLTQMKLTLQVGGTGDAVFDVTMIGSPPGSVVAREPRDIGLVIEPAAGGGFTCTALGSVGNRAVLPITVDELTGAVEDARQALLDVVGIVHDGDLVFQHQLDIPEPALQKALRILAPAGARLFQRTFLHPLAGEDAKAVGAWLRDYATDPTLQLTIQVLAERMPLPWSILYLGNAGEGAQLDWDLFLGMRHIIEQLPLQNLAGTKTNEIASQPALSVSTNVNQTIDAKSGLHLVADHERYWAAAAAARPGLQLVPRSTRAEVLRALQDPQNHDQLIYFYCHATSAGDEFHRDDDAAIIMGDNDAATVGYLNLNASTETRLTERPLVFINACDSANLSPRFYDGFVPYFMAKGARGVIGTECKTPVLFAIRWAEAFLDRFLGGAALGETVLALRREFLHEHRNPLGLLYAVHCDAETQIAPPLVPAEQRTGANA
ncbi:MAG TPA: CHAT domain-containing protein [Mycobacterium sp.]|nr:CHAT domain-containing protein [Mycobacterium sp.]HTX97411.1 CHAT domain-containing protein [Mycobacterium sp.]